MEAAPIDGWILWRLSQTPGPWAVDDLERELGGHVVVADGVGRLVNGGLALRMEGGFVVASAAGPLRRGHRGRMVVTATERVGRNIRRIRRAADLSQEAAAERAGLQRSALSVYETGRQEPKLETILKIAGALGVEPGALFDGVGWEPGRFGRGAFVFEEES